MTQTPGASGSNIRTLDLTIGNHVLYHCAVAGFEPLILELPVEGSTTMPLPVYIYAAVASAASLKVKKCFCHGSEQDLRPYFQSCATLL
jgi:hypothetical protein